METVKYHLKTSYYDVMTVNNVLATRNKDGYFISGVLSVITAKYFKIGDIIVLCVNPAKNHFGKYRVDWVINERIARSVVRPYWQELRVSKIN